MRNVGSIWKSTLSAMPTSGKAITPRPSRARTSRSHLEQARKDGRIGHVPLDPVLPVKAFFDIGGAGHSSDAMAIWICQFVGREIRLLDYIEGVGQPLGFYATELRRRGWKDAIIHLPHDGVATTISPASATSITGSRLASSALRRSRIVAPARQ